MASKTPLLQPAYNDPNWNTPLNSNFDVITNALGSITSVTVTSANVTMTSTQAQSMAIAVSGSMSNDYSLFLPAGIVGSWVLTNSTSGGRTLSVYVDNGAGSPAGAGVLPPSGTPIIIFSDGTNVKFANDYVSVTVLPGFILPFGGSSVPTGWLSCNGSVVSQTTYASLYAAIGTTWNTGSEGAGNFRLPNLQGAFLRGSGSGLNPVSRAVGSYQADDVKPHTHSVTDPGHSHTYVGSSFSNGAYSSGGRADTSLTRTTDSATTGITINNSTGTETVPKNYAVLYCIKY